MHEKKNILLLILFICVHCFHSWLSFWHHCWIMFFQSNFNPQIWTFLKPTVSNKVFLSSQALCLIAPSWKAECIYSLLNIWLKCDFGLLRRFLGCIYTKLSEDQTNTWSMKWIFVNRVIVYRFKTTSVHFQKVRNYFKNLWIIKVKACSNQKTVNVIHTSHCDIRL